MIKIALLLLGVSCSLAQYIALSPWTVPFTGNPLVKDTSFIPLSYLAKPWKDVKMVDDSLVVKKVKFDDMIEKKMVTPINNLCLTMGIGCGRTDLFIDPILDDEKCLKKWGLNCVTIARMSPVDLCRNTGMGCAVARMSMIWRTGEKVFTDEKSLPWTSEKVFMDEKSLCLKMRIGCEKLCMERGFGCELRGTMPVVEVN